MHYSLLCVLLTKVDANGLYASRGSARLAAWRSRWTVASPMAIRRVYSQLNRFGLLSTDVLTRLVGALQL
jgi:hypothetical protein